MKLNVYFIAVEPAPGDNLIDRLPWATRLWLAFQAGVTRRVDLLSVSRLSAEQDQVRL